MKKVFQNYWNKRVVVLFLLAFFLPPPLGYGQEIVPLVNARAAVEKGTLSPDEAIIQQLDFIDHHAHTNILPIKCSVPLTLMVTEYEHLLSEKTKKRFNDTFSIQKALASESFVSTSGNFTISYETSGVDAVPAEDSNNNLVPDYVEWIAEAADSSYNHLLGLGFTDIFTIKSAPFEIRVANGNAYGFVPPNAPYIGIENDFIGFPDNDDPEGSRKGAVKVTIAHELKHVFQFVQNGWVGNPNRWLEMDATLYEEVIYDEVNDYYNYLRGFGNGNFFRSPTTSQAPGSYEDIAWALFFEERFGNTFWTKVWSIIESESPSITYLDAIEDALSDFNVSFEEATIENLLWHFASGSFNSTPFYSFDENIFYPEPRLEESFTELQKALSTQETLVFFTGKYFEFDSLDANEKLLRIDIIPSSPDIQTGLIAYYDDSTVETFLITNPLANVLNIKETNFSWSQIDRLGVVFFNSSTSTSQTVRFQVYDYLPSELSSPELSQNYPNPFNPNTTITVSLPFSQQVKLSVYDYLGRQVQTLQNGVLPSGTNPIRFNASGLSSGIYFYRLETDTGIITKKMTLIK